MKGAGVMNTGRIPRPAETTVVPPRINRKNKEYDDLLLFRDLHKRENRHSVSLLQPISDHDYDINGSCSLDRTASGKKEAPAYDFLVETNKNDYDWLKTPPATPLFPSLELELNSSQLVLQREIPIIHPLSRTSKEPRTGYSAGTGPSKSAAIDSRAKSSNLKVENNLILIVSSGNVNPGPNSTTQTPYTKPAEAERKNNKLATLSFDQTCADQHSKSNKSTTHISVTSKGRNHIKENHLSCINATRPASINNNAKNSSRRSCISPSITRSSTRANQAQFISLEFSNETPPNLKTTPDQRSSSTTRPGRLSNPTVITRHQNNVNSSGTPVGARTKSCSPITRGRGPSGKTEINLKGAKAHELSTTSSSRSSTANNERETCVTGSKMVDMVMHRRKSSGVRQINRNI